MKRLGVLFTLTLLNLAGMAAPVSSAKEVVSITSVTSNGTDTFPSNPPIVLVTDAQGDYNYAPPVSPGTGGGPGGYSWHTYTSNGTPPISLTFNFAHPARVNEVVLWDYYGHSPSDWTVKLFSGPDATGTQLVSHDFSIGTGFTYDYYRWPRMFANSIHAQSAVLLTRSNSYWGGVGLGEVAFVVPEPTACTLATLAIISCIACAGRRH